MTATKYWPGGMGYTASHALVMAKLIVKGVDKGLHGFIVQLRSLDDFMPMPGIEAGDVGTKIGWNSTDNGYLSFNHVRIPRRHMLARNAKLDRNGTYTPAKNEKLLYGGLTSSRVMIVSTCAFQLAQAATISTRYSSVRQQGFMSLVKKWRPCNTSPSTLVCSSTLHHHMPYSLSGRTLTLLTKLTLPHWLVRIYLAWRTRTFPPLV